MQFGLNAALFDAAYKHFLAGRMRESEQALHQALQADPRHADSLHLLGVLAGFADNAPLSLELFDKAIAQSPGFASAHANRGVALLALDRNAEGIAALRRAVELDPNHVHGLYGLGNALLAEGELDEAAAAFRKAVALSPNHFEARSNLAETLQRQGKTEEAIEAFSQAAATKPDSAHIRFNLGVVLQVAGRLDEAIAQYRETLKLRPDSTGAQSNILLALTTLPGMSGEQLLAEHRAFDAQQGLPSMPAASAWPNAKDPERKLRIGYVSGDFHVHPVGSYLVGPLEAHDREAFEVFCYYNATAEDHVTARIANATDHWRPIFGLTDKQVADLVSHDRIDILIDLSGHTDKNRPRVFALKPAPVQASWLGYPGTTGMSAIDYLVMDASTVPPGANWTSEAVVRLPNGRFCYSPPPYAPEVAIPPERPVTFGSFNNLAKVGPDVVRLWAEVLDAVPGSRLLLKWKELNQPGVRGRMIEAFAAAGIGPDRLELRGPSAHADMLGEYADVDIALDPFPFSGGLTSSEALWMGVPVVTLPQDRAASRQTLAFLDGLDLNDLAASSEADYVRIAAALAADPVRRAELRRTLRERMAAAPMNDPKVFASGLEAAYRRMWRLWCEGKAPEAIAIG